MNDMFSPKQASLISMFKHNRLKRINILEGSVRSGKTWISLFLWALWVASMPSDGAYLMVAKTLTSLRRNCLDLLQSLVGKANFDYNISTKEGRLFGRLIYLEGVNDIRAESKIRGMTLTGSYCDELTLFTEDFFSMLLSRLSDPGAKLFGTTNPDHPMHWLREKYIKRCDELNMMVMRFLIDDNTFLNQEYVAELKKEYTGVFYRRFILGLWVAADGVIYGQFADNHEAYTVGFEDAVDKQNYCSDIQFISIGVDFGGNRSLTTFVASGIHRRFDKITVLADYHIKGKKGDIDSDKVNSEFIAFCRRLQQDYPELQIRYCFADNEAQYLINGLRKACRKEGLSVAIGDSAKNAITQRIICTNTLLNTGRLIIHKNCALLSQGLQSAVWDSKAAEKGKDVRLDNFSTDIDILDAFEYSWERFIPKLLPDRG